MKKSSLSRILCLGLSLVVCLAPVNARAASVRELKSGATSMEKLSMEDIAALLDAPSPASGPFNETAPSYASPWSAGTLKADHLNSGLARLNALRRLAGLGPVELDDAYTRTAQAGAFLNAANGSLSHAPSRPEGMDEALYELGATGASSSNIAMATVSTDRGPIPFSVDMWMDDSDSSNVDRLGHRRWQLDPTMSKTGFGAVPSRTGSGFFSAEYVLDRGGSAPDYDIIAWPSSGYFPDGLFSPSCAWSVTLNPEKYAAPSLSSVTVTLTRASDGRTWTFRGSGYTPSNSGEYFNVDTENYGVNNCVIFRPSGIETYEGVYTVTVSGVKYRSGGAADFKYTVEFFDPQHLPSGSSLPFRDVKTSDWFYPYVKAGTEAGLIKGTSDVTFEPDTELTLAQVVTFAARIAARFRGDTDPTVNDWKAGAYDYCVMNGLINEAEYPYGSLEETATRLDVLRIMDPAIPASAKAEKVTVPSGSIPDVKESDPYGKLIYSWYRAGILEGASGGLFNASSPMVRSAMSAVLCRITSLT